MTIRDTSNQLSPWSIPRDPELIFSIEDLEKFLCQLGWDDPLIWLNHWNQLGGVKLAYSAWPTPVRNDWIWGLGLPFLSDLEHYLDGENNRVIFGISGLPGCGKTSFGKWLEAAASQLGWQIAVISMDDFYLPAAQLEHAMSGNPWEVPRGLPGSHEIKLLETSIDSWVETGDLHVPQFDKALRNGLGDRCGWRHSKPKVLVLEGWFLGCTPSKNKIDILHFSDQMSELISSKEQSYRNVVQESLNAYLPIWKRFERIWHLKAANFAATSSWKVQQEMHMQKQRGTSLQGQSLNSFIRMIQNAIPQHDLQSIDAKFVVVLNKLRQIVWLGNKEN